MTGHSQFQVTQICNVRQMNMLTRNAGGKPHGDRNKHGCDRFLQSSLPRSLGIICNVTCGSAWIYSHPCPSLAYGPQPLLLSLQMSPLHGSSTLSTALRDLTRLFIPVFIKACAMSAQNACPCSTTPFPLSLSLSYSSCFVSLLFGRGVISVSYVYGHWHAMLHACPEAADQEVGYIT